MISIYGDILFFLNSMIDFLLLIITALLGNIPIRKRRFLIAAVCGGTYAVLTVPLQGNEKLILFLLVGWLLCVIAFGFDSLRKTFFQFLLFLFAAAICAGSICAVCFISANSTQLNQSLHEVLRPAPKLIFGTALIVSLLLGTILKGCANEKQVLHMTVSHGINEITVHALVDTGNCLRDPINNAPVLILWKKQALPLFTEQIKRILENTDLNDAASALPQLTAFRLIPYRSIGTKSGFLLSTSAICKEHTKKKTHQICIALSEDPISNGDLFDAIIGI